MNIRFILFGLCLSLTMSFTGSFCLEITPCSSDEKDKIAKVFMAGSESVHESFDNVLWTLERMPWYKSNGYKVPLPPHPVFKDLEEYPEKLKTLDKDKYYKIFASEVYKSLNVEPVQKILNDNASVLLIVLDKFNNLNKKWGFKVFPQYKIALTLYSPGGRYNAYSGVIELLVNDKGFPNNTKKLHETIIHEMVHIGIEDIIVKKFQLSHWEEEGLVDLICALYFKDLMPKYYSHPSGDKRIKEYVTYENICNDLPAAIKQYVAKYPRA